MEIVVYLLAVLLTAFAISIFLLIRKVKRERHQNKNLSALIKASSVFTLTWTTDFSSIETNAPLDDFLKTIGRTADEGFLKSLFLENDSLGTTGSVLLVGAMAKDGRKTVFTLPDGTVKHILWKSKIVSTGDSFTTVATTGTDITDEYVIRKELDATKQQQAITSESLDIAAESADIGILTIIRNAAGSRLTISENGMKMLAVKDNPSYEDFIERISQNDREIFKNSVQRLFSGNSTSESTEINIRIAENTVHHFIFRMKMTKCTSNDLHRITAAFIDTTCEKENLNRHERSVIEDPLTGFLDRNSFFTSGSAYLTKAGEQKTKTATISIKIDRFQKISTLFGIEIADKLLVTYSQGIESCAVKPALFGKMNLDNFAVIMPCNDNEQAAQFVKSLSIFIENACNDKILPSILTEQSRFTAGICFHDGMDDIVTLFNKANMMLFADYSESDGTCRFFDKTVEEKIYNRDTIEDELRTAIKNGEFELYYQPKMSFDNTDIYGAEALIRWNHPVNGVVSPISFIPIAEEVGLITQIDEWGLMEACRQAKLWQDKGYKPLRVSVNMSQAQLYQTDVVASIKTALAESGLSPNYLEVELTETMAMQDIDRTISILKEIQSLGVSVSMDDFGTGYSSLSALKLLPIDILKIDQSLIYDINVNSTSLSIVKAIVDLGKALDLEVLAEGVETEEQSEILNGLGCSIAQGYFYGKPLSAADIERIFLKPTIDA